MKKAERNKRQQAERQRDHAITLLANAVNKGNDKQAKRWKAEAEQAGTLLAEIDKGLVTLADGTTLAVDPKTGEAC
jgi:hypothetical protein